MTEKIKILLVEDNIEMRVAFKTALINHPKYTLFGETGSQMEGLHILSSNEVDVVILDLELEEGNGIELAEQMRQLPIRQPFVVVTTNNTSETIFQYLRADLTVDFIFKKINTSYSANQVIAIIDKVFKYHGVPSPGKANPRENAKEKIYRELHNIGFSPSLLGSDYIASALLYLFEHPDEPIHMSKIIYPALAKKYITSPRNIEKAIRTSIEHVWSHSNLDRLERYYPYEIDNENGRPTNSEFIAQMRRKLFGGKRS